MKRQKLPVRGCKCPETANGWWRDFSPSSELHSSDSSRSWDLPATELARGSKPICPHEELQEKLDSQCDGYWIPFITFIKLSCASLLLYFTAPLKKNHWRISLPLKIQKSKSSKDSGEKGAFTMTFRAKREKQHFTDH